MTAIGRIIAVGMLVLSLTACGSRFNFVGTWVGRHNLSGETGADPVILNTFAKTTITIKENGRFEMFHLGLPRSGEVHYEDGSARLVVKGVLNKPAQFSHEIVLRPKSEEEVEMHDPEHLGKQVVILRRESQP